MNIPLHDAMKEFQRSNLKHDKTKIVKWKIEWKIKRDKFSRDKFTNSARDGEIVNLETG